MQIPSEQTQCCVNLINRASMSLPKNTDSIKTDFVDARCARLTGPGRSAVAVIALRGGDAQALINRCFDPVTQRDYAPTQIRYGDWHGGGEEEHAESVVVSPMADDSIEIHCHGGQAAITRILNDLRGFGATEVPAETLAKGPDTPRCVVEAKGVLNQCRTKRIAAIVLEQTRGTLVNWASHWQQQLTSNEPARDGLVGEFHRQLDVMLELAEFTLRLTDPFRVVICGPPNVGKSSLSNAILGYQRSIIFDEAGTTRDVLHAEAVIGGIPMCLSDTAGFRESPDTIEQAGIKRATIAISDADLVILVTEPAISSGQETSPTSLPDWHNKPCLRVLNKCDLLDDSHREPDELSRHRSDHIYQTAALHGDGIKELMLAIEQELVAYLPEQGQPILLTQRQKEVALRMRTDSDTNQTVANLRELIG